MTLHDILMLLADAWLWFSLGIGALVFMISRRPKPEVPVWIREIK